MSEGARYYNIGDVDMTVYLDGSVWIAKHDGSATILLFPNQVELLLKALKKVKEESTDDNAN